MSEMNEGKNKNVDNVVHLFGDTVNVDNIDKVVKSLSIDHIGFVQLFPNHHNISPDISYSIGSSKELPNGVNITQNIIRAPGKTPALCVRKTVTFRIELFVAGDRENMRIFSRIHFSVSRRI